MNTKNPEYNKSSDKKMSFRAKRGILLFCNKDSSHPLGVRNDNTNKHQHSYRWICGYNKLFNKVFSNERGTALVVSLFMLVLITGMGITATNRTIVEGWLSTNYRLSKQSFYVAEAGLEFTRNALRADANWADNTTAPPGTINVGGRNAAYTISLRNATTNSIIVTSTGTIAGATSVVEALVERGNIPDVPGSVSLVGDITVDKITSNAFDIDGRNHGLGGKPIQPVTDPKLGISVNDVPNPPGPANRVNAIRIAAEKRKNNITGAGDNPSVGTGTLTRNDVSNLVSTIKNMANPNFANPNNWPKTIGTVAAPEIVYVKITGTGTTTITGNTEGFGILIIDVSSPIRIAGTVNWNGLVIITGDNVNVDLSGTPEIRGALIINENPGGGNGKFDITGNVDLLYSKEAVNIAQQTMPAVVSSWRQVHN